MKRLFSLLSLLVFILGVVLYLAETPQQLEAPQSAAAAAQEAAPATDDATVAYELPAPDTTGATPILAHIAYTVGFAPEWNMPRWVAYQLTAEETLGDEGRSDKFLPDPLLGPDAVTTKDYTGSGYDRGHMAPAADMKWSAEAMQESFYMSNICPQVHGCNAGDWKELENLVRDIAATYESVYVCCGPVVTSTQQTIGTVHQVVVPSAFYKVLLRRKAAHKWVAIGFIMPNTAGSKPLLTYMHSVDEVEELTGLDFFAALPDDLEQQAEADFAPADWTVAR